MSTTLTPEADVVSRLAITMTPAGASDLLNLRFSEKDNERMIELLEKGNRGIRTAEEESEAHGFERIGHLISMLKSVARRTLKQS